LATTFTPNLRLAVDSNLTANAKTNLFKIDALGSTFTQDASSNTLVRSVEDLYFLPNNPSIGGSGTGGSIFFGSASQSLTGVTFYSDNLSIGGTLSLLDEGTGGTKYLLLKYDSTLSGSVDTAADRTLSIDLEGASRSLILGANLSISSANLSIGGVSYSLPASSATLVDLDDAQTLSNKSLSGASNTFSNIGYSSLVLTSSIVNADVSASAAISYSKLNLSSSITNNDVSNSAAIAYSKLDLAASIVNADVAVGAAIAGTKIAPDFGSSNVRTTGEVQIARNGSIASKFVASGSQAADISYTLPASAPTANQVLRYDGSVLEWASVGSGTVTSVALSLSAELDSILDATGSPITTSGTLGLDLATQAANLVLAGPSSGSPAKPTFRSLVADDVPTLTTSKLSDWSSAWDTRLGTKTTTDLAEGTNLYFTTARVDTQVATYKVTATWAPGDGTTKGVTHNLGTTDISWNLYDVDSGEEIWPDTATRTSPNAITLVASSAPTGSGWRLVIRK
jgi:hypothetical protein